MEINQIILSITTLIGILGTIYYRNKNTKLSEKIKKEIIEEIRIILNQRGYDIGLFNLEELNLILENYELSRFEKRYKETFKEAYSKLDLVLNELWYLKNQGNEMSENILILLENTVDITYQENPKNSDLDNSNTIKTPDWKYKDSIIIKGKIR
jgi:hypothetical protein